MKAAQLTDYGGKEAVSISDIPVPQMAEGKILVEVHAAGVNPIDWKVQLGYLKEHMPLVFPVTMGGDFAGVIAQVGADITQYKKGDGVYGQASILAADSGSFAEFALMKPGSIAIKPKNLDFIAAASLPLAGVSAVQAIIQHLGLQKGQKILIHGGAGGIGSFAVQIAKHLGAHVATTVSSEDLEYVKALGADQIIDYKTETFEDSVREFDAVFDTVGGEIPNRSLAVLKKGGKIVSMVGPIDEKQAKAAGVEALAQQTRVTTERLDMLTKFVEDGIITPHVEKTFSLQGAGDALEYLHKTPPKGKLVLRILRQ